MLRGVERVRLLETEVELAPGKLYRSRHAKPAPESSSPVIEATVATSTRLRSLWQELLEKTGKKPETAPVAGLEALSFESLVNAIATFADIPPTAKQALLEEDDVLLRGKRLEGHLAETLRSWTTLARFRASRPDDPSVN